VTEREEGRTADCIIETVTYVDVFAIDNATTLGAPIQVGWVVGKTMREG